MIDINFFQRICAQAETIFPDSSSKDHLTKALGEIQEAIDAPESKRLIEYADSFHCLVAAMGKDGFTLHDLYVAAEYKLTVNKHRKWERKPDGTYQHVPE